MTDFAIPAPLPEHAHVFLGEGNEQAERRTWSVIVLCGCMMLAEIVGGILFGSIALVADGLHMSTHAGALLLAALAYRFSRKHAHDPRFTFGTGKLGDLAGFTSAIVLAMIALLIGYEAIDRFFFPVPIHFAEAIPIACLGLAVNIASAWLLSRGGDHHHHGHSHGHSHSHGHDGHDHDETHRIPTSGGMVVLEVFEDGAPPRFRLHAEAGPALAARSTLIETVRPDGSHQQFPMVDRGAYLESAEEIPEPHAFTAHVRINGAEHAVIFEEHEHAHGSADRDNNMRAAIIHVMADAAVSVLVIAGLLLARAFGWLWMDPLAGIAGACVIASWSYGLIRDTGAILLEPMMVTARPRTQAAALGSPPRCMRPATPMPGPQNSQRAPKNSGTALLPSGRLWQRWWLQRSSRTRLGGPRPPDAPTRHAPNALGPGLGESGTVLAAIKAATRRLRAVACGQP